MEKWLVAAAVVVATWLFTRITGLVLRRVVRHLADRAVRRDSGPWRVRSGRTGEESSSLREQRRRQRVDAASRMLNHLVSVVVWIVALIVVFHVLEVDAAFFLSSAGFLGAAMAIGGQHKVNDYLTGLLVHFEDRYGVADRVEWETPVGTTVSGVVEHVGLFTTRVRDENGSIHVPNTVMNLVRNLSQEASATTLRLKVHERIDSEAVSTTLRDLAGTAGLTDVIFLSDIESHQPATGEIEIEVTTPRPLDPRERARLVQRAEEALRRDGAD
ncbi:MAG: mechanosensitive ion channel [Actinomycetota bacterium]|nr:mechanosensitive ion channel [Actinomycetota bacterium]MDA3015657.1 mechanosensitive ion channel [Actinomycetota bacterium]MDA3027453.1 mechanosensitive ion channel [Actinomycetota bacterium]